MSQLLHFSGIGPVKDLIQDIPNRIITEMSELNLSDNLQNRIMEVMESEMKKGLSRDKEVRQTSSLRMENTYVRDVMNGKEHGDFLALDLGGTNFRVLHMTMTAGKLIHFVSKTCKVPDEKLYGPVSEVFDHIAENIANIMYEEGIENKKTALGFTFSFPILHESVRSGILVKWNKGFKCTDGVGIDVVKLLEDAISRRGDVDVEVLGILNDTTGTLMSGAYLDHHCQIGLILGTGCNACYVEHLENVDKWINPGPGPNEVIINMEWGAFGDNGSIDFMKTDIDIYIDKHSHHPGVNSFEKLFSGMYTGEIFRLYLLKYIELGLIFSGKGSDKLKKGSVESSHVSSIEKDILNFKHTLSFLRELNLNEEASSVDVATVRFISEMITIRAAKIISAGLAVLLNHIKKPEVSIAIDGSMYKYHPTLKHLIKSELDKLVPNMRTRLILAEDGSGHGAGYVAAVMKRLSDKS